MDGKVVLVTGANGALGSEVTRVFLDAGARVIGVSRSIKQSDFAHDKFTALAGDATDAAEAARIVADVVSQFARIDVLVHVMGGFAAGKLHETDDATWARMRDLNLTAAFYIFRAVIPHMRKARSGRILAVGSRVAHERHAGIAAYSATKLALASLIESVAAENKDAGITANIVLPGTMDTPANRTPGADTSRWIPPRSVAELLLYLASDKGTHINGAAIPVSGFDV